MCYNNFTKTSLQVNKINIIIFTKMSKLNELRAIR